MEHENIFAKELQKLKNVINNSKHDKEMNMLDNIIYYLLLIVILMCLLVFFFGFINILDDI